MDQTKIGKFIAVRRKQANLTQIQLAEKLNITDRAISKWETGKAMPDSSIMPLLAAVVAALIIPMEESRASLMVAVSLVPLLIATPFALKIEQAAGYYECAKCNHRYVPAYKHVFMAMHIGRTRYMRCPKCNQKSWQKKVLSKE